MVIRFNFSYSNFTDQIWAYIFISLKARAKFNNNQTYKEKRFIKGCAFSRKTMGLPVCSAVYQFLSQRGPLWKELASPEQMLYAKRSRILTRKAKHVWQNLFKLQKLLWTFPTFLLSGAPPFMAKNISVLWLTRVFLLSIRRGLNFTVRWKPKRLFTYWNENIGNVLIPRTYCYL